MSSSNFIPTHSTINSGALPNAFGYSSHQTPIPNSLSITLLTKIPGFQKIKYKPSMSIPTDDKNEIVYFNPLIKINKGAINKIPENTIKQFFNKGLYDSLLNESLSLNFTGNIKNLSLKEAKQKGYIDNNIQLTLETLFKPNNVIYIGKKPYVISNNIFDNSSWNLDIKEINPVNFHRNNITHYNYNNAAVELAQNDPDVIAGSTAPTPSTPLQILPAPAPAPAPTPTPTPSTPLQILPTPSRPLQILPAPSTPLQILPAPSTPLQILPAPAPAPAPTPTPAPSTPLQILPSPTPNKPLLLERAVAEGAGERGNSGDVSRRSLSTKTLHLPTSQNDIPSDIIGFTKIDASKDLPKKMREYFLLYSWILNQIYEKLSRDNKLLIIPSNKNGEPPPKITSVYYTGLVSKLQIIPFPGDGNCFFYSVAYGINSYNENNTDITKQIKYDVVNQDITKTYGLKGKSIFTQEVIRRIVIDYYNDNIDKLREKLELARENVSDMNETYTLLTDNIVITEVLRRNTVDSIWNTSGKFFLTKRSTDDTDVGNMTPFSVIDNPNEISKYIMSREYWASEEIYAIIQNKLGIKIICIVQTNDNISVKAIGQKEINTTNLLFVPTISKEDDEKMGSYNKYIFLRQDRAAGHYDLITFQLDDKNKKKTIFEKQPKNIIIPLYNLDILPPIYILFLIYGQYYSKIIPEENRNNITLFSNELKMINDSFNLSVVQAIPRVNDIFNTLFSSSRRDGTMIGGTIPYSPSSRRSSSTNASGVKSYQTPSATAYGYGSLQNLNIASGPPSNLSYHITVELVLYPGTSIPLGKYPALICEKNSAVMSEAWSKLNGTIYAPRPSTNTGRTKPRMNLERAVAEGAGERGNSGYVSRRSSVGGSRRRMIIVRRRSRRSPLGKLRLSPSFSSTRKNKKIRLSRSLKRSKKEII